MVYVSCCIKFSYYNILFRNETTAINMVSRMFLIREILYVTKVRGCLETRDLAQCARVSNVIMLFSFFYLFSLSLLSLYFARLHT